MEHLELAMLKVEELLGMKRKQLMEVLCAGHPIDPSELDDMEYKGISLGLPRWVEKLSWKKFKKTFHRDPDTGELRGWNVRIEQNAMDEPWVPMKRGDGLKTFGHYQVVDPAGYRMPKLDNRGLLIDYGLGDNGRFDPMKRMRDPLVAVNEGSSELLLGWSYVDLGFMRLGTPSFFSLERDIPLSHRVVPPRRRRQISA